MTNTETVVGSGFDDNTSMSFSADGRYLTFNSSDNSLVAVDTNGVSDAFVRDRVAGKTTLVSVASDGAQGNATSAATAISADGRYVVLESDATNLVAGDTNGVTDVFVLDRLTGTTTRVSVSSAGAQGNDRSGFTSLGYNNASAISADGRYVVFNSSATNLVAGDTNGASDVFIHDRKTGKTSVVSVNSAGAQGNGNCIPSAISADGRYVLFNSDATNLVAGDTNGVTDAFVRDRVAATTTRISVSSAGAQRNGYSNASAISADGRYVAFTSTASNLAAGDINNEGSDTFVRDRLLDNTHSADLQVTAIAKPASVKKGQTARYLLKVRNNGPDRAGKVNLTHIVINGTMTGIRPSRGDCSKAAVSVCNLDFLAAGKSVWIKVEIRADANPLTLQTSINAAPKDNGPSNNVIKIATSVLKQCRVKGSHGQGNNED